MRASLKFLTAAAAALVLSACGSSSSSSSSAPQNAVVKTATNSKLGKTVLVDAQGMTLYRLSGEQSGKFICSSAGCLKVWHPLIAVGGGTPSGSVGSLGTAQRAGIGEQVTYKGMPLYTFAEDRAPGEASGQGIKDVGTWDAVAATGKSASSPTTPASSGGSASGY